VNLTIWGHPLLGDPSMDAREPTPRPKTDAEAMTLRRRTFQRQAMHDAVSALHHRPCKRIALRYRNGRTISAELVAALRKLPNLSGKKTCYAVCGVRDTHGGDRFNSKHACPNSTRQTNSSAPYIFMNAHRPWTVERHARH